jgi:hypothetical protein
MATHGEYGVLMELRSTSLSHCDVLQVLPGARPPYWVGCDFNASTQAFTVLGAVSLDDAKTHASTLVSQVREGFTSRCEAC